ncbi:hypothetical protein EYR38_009229 [Pleurotus pulmonarius]|nr:hypothetical protein EYR38_009229 [Pleurotus pulmonarius]
MLLLGIFLSETILLLRVWSFWGRTKKITIFLCILGTLEFTSAIVSYALSHFNFLSLNSLSTDISGCHSTSANALAFVDYILLMSLDTIILILTIIRCLRDSELRFPLLNHPSALITLFIREGVISFFFLFTSTLINLILILTDDAQEINGSDFTSSASSSSAFETDRHEFEVRKPRSFGTGTYNQERALAARESWHPEKKVAVDVPELNPHAPAFVPQSVQPTPPQHPHWLPIFLSGSQGSLEVRSAAARELIKNFPWNLDGILQLAQHFCYMGTLGCPNLDLFAASVNRSLYSRAEELAHAFREYLRLCCQDRFMGFWDMACPNAITFQTTDALYVRSAMHLTSFIGDLFKRGLLLAGTTMGCMRVLLRNTVSCEHLEALRNFVLQAGKGLWFTSPSECISGRRSVELGRLVILEFKNDVLSQVKKMNEMSGILRTPRDGKIRELCIMRNPFHPEPAPPGFAEGKIAPEERASIFSRIVFHWLTPLLQVGFSRPLQKEDLWELTPPTLATSLTRRVETEFYSRCPPEKRPAFLKDLQPKQGPPKTDESLFKALHRAFLTRWWVSGVFYLAGETLRTTTPLVTKVFLIWLTESYIYHQLPQASRDAPGLERPKGIGFGIGLAFAIFTMQQCASLFTNHFYMMAMTNGLRVRSALIGNIFRKSLRLSGRARAQHGVGQITTMISTDSERLDAFSSTAHGLWVAPIQIILCIGLLIGNLGYSALVGLGVLIFGMIPQGFLAAIIFKQRQTGVKFTDARMRLTTEVLQGIRILKAYGWETFYAHQIEKWRRKEIKTLKISAAATSGLIALVGFIPILSAILSFITYALTNHDLNIAIIFSSLQLFNVILVPMATFPIVLGSLSGAIVALNRISTFLLAEELPEPYPIDVNSKYAVDVDADFTWEITEGVEEKFSQPKEGSEANEEEPNSIQHDKQKNENDRVLDVVVSDADEKEDKDEDKTPYSLKGLKMQIERGQFIAIVGRVGSGKSSVLQALIGEMRKTSGNVTLGGTISYVPQRPWIRNATVRENILFGQPADEVRLRQVIRACSLDHDLTILPQGEETEIGEKGINLSGGQKARVSLARAAYSNTDIAILDDPISAVDAHVGKALLENCLLSGPLANRTRILVTHALHVLPKVDYIYVVENGQIAEQGTYADLVESNLAFSRVLEEFGSQGNEPEAPGQAGWKHTQEPEEKLQGGPLNAPSQLMQEEERVTGAVSWRTYSKYFRHGGSILWMPLIFALLVVDQCFFVATSLFLSFWTSSTIPGFTQANYMTAYGLLAVGNALASFSVALSFFLTGLIAGFNIFRKALASVLKSPTAFFDTTPMGRVLTRFSKDQDVLDSQLPAVLYSFMATIMSMFGTAGLVFYTFPYLGIMFAPMAVVYYVIAKYYRRTSIETKRLDSLMRSRLYASYSEALTGLPTIRAHRIQESSIDATEHGLDMQNRAYYVTLGIQRWLAVRLDLSANILILGISLFGAGFRETIDPSKVALVLTYTLSVALLFTQVVNLFAENEQNMNSVERMLVYTELPPEGDQAKPSNPPPSWPSEGEIEFTDVNFGYRDGLPSVLRDVCFRVRPGEKIGIVGRTGSGKSSLLQALFRLTELRAGKIVIDGVDIRNVGLDVLRSQMALVPQDSTLFLGTLRENLDPQKSRTDAELISILQTTGLLPLADKPDSESEKKFSLDAVVGDEGLNYSVGERQLLSLCRALVKDSRIIVLDEATSNVDVETDSRIQRTIQNEWASSTLICIAHRLNTIAYYDRVLVMDSGRVADFDTVLNLFDKEEGIFRALCDESLLTREDILRIRANANAALVLASLVASSSASDVVNLTALSFETFVRHEPLLLVKFCSWVGHCKALAPHYEAAATALKAKNIKVAEVDCDEDPDFCQAQKVQGYPTLSVFRYGSRTDDYTGIPEADGIISYMVEQSLPAVSVVTAANHEDFLKAYNQVVVAVAYLASTTESPAAEFSAVAEKHRDRSAYVFGLSVDKEAMSSAGITPPAIVVYRSFDEPKTMYPSLPLSAFSTPGLEEWILNLSIPVIDEIRAENHAIYVSSTKPLAYLFLDPSSPEKEALIEAIRPIAKKYKPHVNFVWTDAVKFVAHAKALHLTEVKWPALAICSHYAASAVQDLGRGQLAYPLDQSKDVTPEAVEDWLHQFINGKLEPSLRSAPIPETQDEPVFTVVGKQFGEIVLDDSKDVFIEFYTTWCGHCKRLKPVWHSLGEKYAPLKDKVTIAKMELIENELPPSAPFRVPGVPAFKFKPAGSREFIDYDGHRSLEDFVAFVQDHARNNLEKPVLSTEGEGVGQIPLGTETVVN